MKIENLLPIEDRQKWIKMDDCKDGWLYLIHARNAHLGIFDQAKKGFVISRHKFDRNFLLVEYHWDTGEPHGTVKPIKEIEKAPTFASEEEKLEYLNRRGQEIVFNPWDKTTDERPGKLISREHGTMNTARTRDMKAYMRVYREANREKILARQRARYRANRKKILARRRAWFKANREKLRALSRAYHRANREKIRASQRAYRKANREKLRALSRARYRANRKKILASARAYYWANVENERARKRVNRSEKPANVRR